MCVLVILIIGISSLNGQTGQSQERSLIRLTGEWEYRWGESPLDAEGMPLWTYQNLDSPDWKPTTRLEGIPGREGEETIWFRCPFPLNSPPSPSLFIPRVFLKLQVYIDKELVHTYGHVDPSRENRRIAFEPQLISLPENVQGRTLFLRVQSKAKGYIGIEQPVLLGSEKELLVSVIRASLPQYILGMFCILAGLLALGAYMSREVRKTPSVLCFGLFSLAIGAVFISSVAASQIIIPAQALWYYLLFISFLVFPPAQMAFVDFAISRGFFSIVRRLWQFHILHGIIALALEFTGTMPLVGWQIYLQYVWIIDMLVVMVVCIHAAVKGNIEARIFTVGLCIFSIFAMTDIIKKTSSISFMPFGTFLFILLLVYLLFRKSLENSRKLRVYSKELESAKNSLEEYSHTLEQRVEERTQELKEKNNQLQEAFTELEAAQNQLVMREKMASLGNLVAGVAHEINNPVGAVHSAADVSRRSISKMMELLDEGGSLEEIRNNPRFDKAHKILMDNLNIGSMATERISTIVKSLRKFVRLDEADFQDTDIHECLEDTLTLMSHELKDRVSIVREFGQLPIIQAFTGELNQVFMNLLINASQAIEGKGTIIVRTRADDSWIHIEIEDTGTGISQEDLSKIFDPGFTTKGVGIGTGLGLSISYSIIQKHKGEISVASEPGKGSTFTIKLPLA